MWLNLVEHLLWEQGVAGSNPVIPRFNEDRGVTVSIRDCDSLREGSSPFDPPLKNILTFSEKTYRLLSCFYFGHF